MFDNSTLFRYINPMMTIPKAKRYARIKYTLFFINTALTVIFLFLVQITGLPHVLKKFTYLLSYNIYWVVAAFTVLLSAIYYLFTLPLNFYASFSLEHKFGLSNLKPGAWAGDELKKMAIGLLMYLILAEALYYLLRTFPGSWWFLAATGMIVFSIVLTSITPILIIPLFYKYKELPDSRLKKRLLKCAEKCNVSVSDVYELGLSRTTKKANAAVVGMGATRRIVLGDTLISKYSEDEVEVVLAHELGHHTKHHIWKLIAASSAGVFITFYMIHILSGWIVRMSGAYGMSDIAALPLLLLVFFVMSFLLGPAQSWYSRYLEKEADRFAIEITGLKDAFISCMQRLAEQNLADTEPNKLIEWMLYDHPPISKRIAMAKETK